MRASPSTCRQGVHVEHDGPLLRFTGLGGGGFVGYRDLAGLTGSELDELIARQVRVFAERNEPFEWKLHGHDQPADLAQRLVAAGFVPDDLETVVIAPVAAIAGDVRAASTACTLREVTERGDLERIGRTEEEIWARRPFRMGGGQPGGRAGGRSRTRSRSSSPRPTTASCAPDGCGSRRGPTSRRCGAAARCRSGAAGGSTTPSSRTAPTLAATRGFGYLQVDASSDSRPILERLGFVAVTTTTPYVWTPPPDAGGSTD